jgi:RNA polymerase sigma-70 factor (ECF subfamily)
MSDEDFSLLDRWIAGDAKAGNQLFKQYFAPLYRFFANKTDGEVDDLVQETFMACLKGRETFRRQSSFRTYLFAIARYTLLGHWRRRATAQHDVPVEDISIASLSTSAGSRLAGREDRARLLEALRKLPMDQQILLEMYYWQELDRDRLAEIFDVETATIGSRLFRARKQLMESLETAAPPSEDALDAWARSLSA